MSEWETVQGIVPAKSNQYLIGKRGLYKSENLKQYERSFYLQCNKYRNALIDKPFEFHARVYYPSRRADLDNSAKILLDSLQTVKAITNDRNCMRLLLERHIDKTNPRVEFKISEV